MLGFDDRFQDLPEYILGITHEIWEQGQTQTIARYYAEDTPVRSPNGVTLGNEVVIRDTVASLAAFPDRTLLAEDVIWSGDEETGFMSSHRIFSTATHTSDDAYGPASGIKLGYRVIADCATRENVIYDEWLVRDQGAIARQLGIDPQRFAAKVIEAEGGPEKARRPFTPAIDVVGRYTGTGNDHRAGLRYEELASSLMTGEVIADGPSSLVEGLGVPSFSRKSALEAGAYSHVPVGMYDRAVNVCHPGGVYGAGIPDAVAFWSGLHAAFPGARFEVHHRIGISDTDLGERAALRWSLTGTHGGGAMFGQPTGAPVHIMGISHAEFGPWGLRREFVLIDETAIWKQILLHAG